MGGSIIEADPSQVSFASGPKAKWETTTPEDLAYNFFLTGSIFSPFGYNRFLFVYLLHKFPELDNKITNFAKARINIIMEYYELAATLVNDAKKEKNPYKLFDGYILKILTAQWMVKGVTYVPEDQTSAETLIIPRDQISAAKKALYIYQALARQSEFQVIKEEALRIYKDPAMQSQFQVVEAVAEINIVLLEKLLASKQAKATFMGIPYTPKSPNLVADKQSQARMQLASNILFGEANKNALQRFCARASAVERNALHWLNVSSEVKEQLLARYDAKESEMLANQKGTYDSFRLKFLDLLTSFCEHRRRESEALDAKSTELQKENIFNVTPDVVSDWRSKVQKSSCSVEARLADFPRPLRHKCSPGTARAEL